MSVAEFLSLMIQNSYCAQIPNKRLAVFKEGVGRKYFDLKVYVYVSSQEWRSVKSKENRPLSMPEEPNTGRSNVKKTLFSSCC